jgi:hypothetical protein
MRRRSSGQRAQRCRQWGGQTWRACSRKLRSSARGLYDALPYLRSRKRLQCRDAPRSLCLRRLSGTSKSTRMNKYPRRYGTVRHRQLKRESDAFGTRLLSPTLPKFKFPLWRCASYIPVEFEAKIRQQSLAKDAAQSLLYRSIHFAIFLATEHQTNLYYYNCIRASDTSHPPRHLFRAQAPHAESTCSRVDHTHRTPSDRISCGKHQSTS